VLALFLISAAAKVAPDRGRCVLTLGVATMEVCVYSLDDDAPEGSGGKD
jgi:hypothetical protein